MDAPGTAEESRSNYVQGKFQWSVYNVGSTYTVSHGAAKKTICFYSPLFVTPSLLALVAHCPLV